MNTDNIYFIAFITKNKITRREADVLRLKFKGYRNPYIANKLSISIETIRTFTKRIANRIGTNESNINITATYIRFLENRDFQ